MGNKRRNRELESKIFVLDEENYLDSIYVNLKRQCGVLRNVRDNPFILTGTVEKVDMLREMHTCGQKANFHLLCLFSTEHD